MTYKEYIKDTRDNCVKVISECTMDKLEDTEKLKRILWEEDRVTGVLSGHCSSLNVSAATCIKDVLFDSEFLADFNANELNMQTMMQRGAEAIDITARCLALSHVNVKELADREYSRRIEKNCDVRRITSRV
jgi:hypothetical protein